MGFGVWVLGLGLGGVGSGIWIYTGGALFPPLNAGCRLLVGDTVEVIQISEVISCKVKLYQVYILHFSVFFSFSISFVTMCTSDFWPLAPIPFIFFPSSFSFLFPIIVSLSSLPSFHFFLFPFSFSFCYGANLQSRFSVFSPGTCVELCMCCVIRTRLCYSAIMLSCCHAIMLSCYHTVIPSPYHQLPQCPQCSHHPYPIRTVPPTHHTPRPSYHHITHIIIPSYHHNYSSILDCPFLSCPVPYRTNSPPLRSSLPPPPPYLEPAFPNPSIKPQPINRSTHHQPSQNNNS